MVFTKDTHTLAASWESQELTRVALNMLMWRTWQLYPQAVHDDEYGRITLVRCTAGHNIVEAVAIYPESITGKVPPLPGVQIVKEKLDLEDLSKGTGEKEVVAGPVWLGDDGTFEEDPK